MTTTTTTAQVEIRLVYGCERIYPLNGAAEALCRIAGRATLTTGHLADAARVGVRIELVSAPSTSIAAPYVRDIVAAQERGRRGKALGLYLRLNQQAMLYTPRSHKGQRAARLMPAIRAKYLTTTTGSN